MKKKALLVALVAALAGAVAGVLVAEIPSWTPEGWQPITWDGSCRACLPNMYLMRSLCDAQNGDRIVLLAKWADPSDPTTLEYVGGPAVVPGGCAQPLRRSRRLPAFEAPTADPDAVVGVSGR